MIIKCENVVRCGNYNCCHNNDGYYCAKAVVALDATGKCAFIKPREYVKTDASAQTKHNTAFDMEASK